MQMLTLSPCLRCLPCRDCLRCRTVWDAGLFALPDCLPCCTHIGNKPCFERFCQHRLLLNLQQALRFLGLTSTMSRHSGLAGLRRLKSFQSDDNSNITSVHESNSPNFQKIRTLDIQQIGEGNNEIPYVMFL